MLTSPIEAVGKGFIDEQIAAARQKTWTAVHAIAAMIKPGMVEEDATRLANATLRDMGVRKFWHRTHVRFGRNTLKPYMDESEAGVVLKDDDIFFIDIGPVWDGYEGDAGATFVTGSDPEMRRCAAEVQTIFAAAQAAWRSEGLSGLALYRFAEELAAAKGWQLNVRGAGGHRISEFPHSLYFTGSLSDVELVPGAQRWILEIQVRHPQRDFGGFYEDMLAT